MSGKKLGLEGRYKALSTGIKKNKNTISINPMQDDLNKLGGAGAMAASSNFIKRRLALTSMKDIVKGFKGPKSASAPKMVAPKPTVNKKVLESKPIKSKSQAAKLQKEAGKYIKTPGYLTGGQTKIDANKDGKITGDDFKILKARKKGMKVKKANLGLLMANKKLAGAGLLGLGMLAKKKLKLSKGSPGTPQNQDEYRAKYGAPKRKTSSTGNKMKQRQGSGKE
jgi:hypothetical protein